MNTQITFKLTSRNKLSQSFTAYVTYHTKMGDFAYDGEFEFIIYFAKLFLSFKIHLIHEIDQHNRVL